MEDKTVVAIAIRRTAKESLATAISKLPSPIYFPGETDSVIIKPSVYNPTTYGNTSRDMLKAVVRMFNDVAPVTIIESDNPLRSAEDAFKGCSFTELASERVSLSSLTTQPTMDVVINGFQFDTHSFPSLLFENNVLVNLATLKIYPESDSLGGAVKNLFGLLPEVRKDVYHDSLDDVLVDILRVIKPNISILELKDVVIGNREDGNLVHINGVMVGYDPVAMDAVCASFFGINPMKIPYLMRADELNLGVALVEDIALLGTDYQIHRLKNLCDDF